MSPEITITSEELRERVEDRLDRWIPDDVWNRAEPYARHKNEVNRQRHPEIDYYDNDYLVLLTADTVRETEFSDLTHALCDLTVAAVFDRGETVVDEPILYFYNPALVTSDFHESQIFVIEEGGHRFFTERSTR